MQLKESEWRAQQMGIREGGEKKIRILVEIFSIYQKMDSTLLRQTFRPDMWDLREGYGGPNFGEKGSQLFQLL